MFDRVRTLVWTHAAMRGVGPAVIGVLAVSLLQIAPQAWPDPLAIVMLRGPLVALLTWRLSARTRMLAGTGVGVVWNRLLALPGVRALI
jgi:chromate transporter